MLELNIVWLITDDSSNVHSGLFLSVSVSAVRVIKSKLTLEILFQISINNKTSNY